VCRFPVGSVDIRLSEGDARVVKAYPYAD